MLAEMINTKYNLVKCIKLKQPFQSLIIVCDTAVVIKYINFYLAGVQSILRKQLGDIPAASGYICASVYSALAVHTIPQHENFRAQSVLREIGAAMADLNNVLVYLS